MVPVMRDGSGEGMSRNLKPGGALTARADGLEARFALPRLAGPILARIDGRRTLRAIHADVATAEGGPLDWPAFRHEFARLYAVLNGVNKMFLRRAPASSEAANP
jgi:hypothetical protein